MIDTRLSRRHSLHHVTSFTAASVLGILVAVPSAAQDAPAHASPLDLVNGLHTAFGEHHARAVHTKGVMLEGSFTPAMDAAQVHKGADL